VKLLLDHCVPHRFARAISDHEAITAAQMQWDRLRNGALLAAASKAGFYALITADQNLKHEQNQSRLPIAVVVLCSVSNDIDELIKLVPRLLEVLQTLQPRQLIEVRS
jgi:predicted nuclease of predicted toxin-antitoxin system